MSASSISTALDEIVTLFDSYWSPRPVEYPNRTFVLPATSVTWARFTILHATGGQITLAGNTGRSRFDRQGSIIIQVFTPLDRGVSNAYDAAELAMRPFEGNATASGVWFRNVRLAEPDAQTGLWYQLNVIADFEYDQYR